MEATRTCTVRTATRGACGKPAVFVAGEFAECAACAAAPGALATAAPRAVVGVAAVGDKVTVHRYGKAYVGTVVHVGARGAVYAEFVYGNGAKRRVRV